MIVTTPTGVETIAVAQQQVQMFDAARNVAASLTFPGGPELPPEHLEAIERYEAANAIVTAGDRDEFVWPAKPTDVGKAVAAEAQRRSANRYCRIVAAEACEKAANAALSTLRDVLADGLAALDEKFKATAAAFLAASHNLPAQLTGRDSEQTVTAFIGRSDAAGELDGLVWRRLSIGQALAEQGTSGGSIWPFTAVPGHSYEPLIDRAHRQVGQSLVADDLERLALLSEVATDYYIDQRGWSMLDAVARWTRLLAVIDPSIAAFHATEDRAETGNNVLRQAPQVPWMTALGLRDRQLQLPAKFAEQLRRRATELAAA